MHQSLIWDRTRQVQRLRSSLREFFPAALEAYEDLASPDVLELLTKAPEPSSAARLTRAQITAALKRAHRRDRDTKTTAIMAALRTEHLTQPPVIAAAYGATVRALAALITTSNEQITALEGPVEACFGQHPDAEIYLSQPGLGPILGARVLAEFGDDPTRYDGARARKNYAGTSPITRASGKKKVVLARYVRNKRLADAVHRQAFSALSGSPGARAYYDAAGSRYRLQRRPAPARQPPGRHPARLPQNPHPLRRGHCVEPAHPTSSSMTSKNDPAGPIAASLGRQQPVDSPRRCHYADDPARRPRCTLSATLRYGAVALCPSCNAGRSTLGKGQAPVPLPAGPAFDVLGWVATAHQQAGAAEATLAAAVTRARQGGATWVSDASGDPILVVMAEPGASLAIELRRLLPELRRVVGDHRRVLVGFDRGGWSPQLFAPMDAAGFAVLTWRKGSAEDVDPDLFGDLTYVDDTGRTHAWLVADTTVDLPTNDAGEVFTMRQVSLTVPGTKTSRENDGQDATRQIHILTTRTDLPVEQVIYRMGSRWRQENYFRYARMP